MIGGKTGVKWIGLCRYQSNGPLRPNASFKYTFIIEHLEKENKPKLEHFDCITFDWMIVQHKAESAWSMRLIDLRTLSSRNISTNEKWETFIN